MTRKGHKITGVALAAVFFAMGLPAAAVAAFFGSTAPDTLEISYRSPTAYRGYARVIPHRTITHWLPLWMVILGLVVSLDKGYLSLGFPYEQWVIQACYGYITGVVMHLVCDMGTPMGIPVWRPFGRRFSLNLYKTGQGELKMIVPVVLVAAGTVYLALAGDPFAVTLASVRDTLSNLLT